MEVGASRQDMGMAAPGGVPATGRTWKKAARLSNLRVREHFHRQEEGRRTGICRRESSWRERGLGGAQRAAQATSNGLRKVHAHSGQPDNDGMGCACTSTFRPEDATSRGVRVRWHVGRNVSDMLGLRHDSRKLTRCTHSAFDPLENLVTPEDADLSGFCLQLMHPVEASSDV